MKTISLLMPIFTINCLYSQTESITLNDVTNTSIFSISGSPIIGATLSGTLSLDLTNQTGFKFLASPSGGGSGEPLFRTIDAIDLPIVASGTQGIISNNTGSTQVLGDGDKEFPDRCLFADGATFDNDFPSITFHSSTTTGLYLTTGGDTRINFTVAGTKRAHMTADGSFSVANNPAFTNQLDINISHDSYEGVDPEDAQDGGIGITTYGGDPEDKLFTSTFTGRTSSGTYDAPLPTEKDQAMAEFSGKGWCVACGPGGSDDFEPSNRGVFGIYAANDQTSTSQGAYCAIQTTKQGNYGMGGISNHFSFLVDPNGNGGLTWLETGGFGTSLPTGWLTDDNARFFSIESSEPTKDIGLLIQNGDATNTTHGTKGINIWYDNSDNITYFDNIRSDGTPLMITRLQTLGTPITAIVTSLTGTNFGGDTSPDNVFTVGSTSQLQVNSTGKIVKYNNISTVGNGVPSEIVTIDLIEQSSAISPTTIYTTPAGVDGLYRVTWVATVTTSATTSSTLGDFQVKYTDPAETGQVKITNTIANITRNAGNNTQTSVISGTYVIYAKGGSNIQYVMDYASSGATAMEYNLHIKLEAL